MNVCLYIGLFYEGHLLSVIEYLIYTRREVVFSDSHLRVYAGMFLFVASTSSDSVINLYITGLTRVTLGAISAFLDVQGDYDFMGHYLSRRVLNIYEYNKQTGEYECVFQFKHHVEKIDVSNSSVFEYGKVCTNFRGC